MAQKLAIQRIVVRIKVGEHLLSATDDPVFLGLRGRAGREFRLELAKGKTLRKNSHDRFVLGSPDDSETNVSNPELNDPTQPALDPDDIGSLFIRKGFDPIPNVRAIGEMDDRLEVHSVEAEIHVAGNTAPIRFYRSGPIWLGLVCGLRLEIPRVEAES